MFAVQYVVITIQEKATQHIMCCVARRRHRHAMTRKLSRTIFNYPILWVRVTFRILCFGKYYLIRLVEYAKCRIKAFVDYTHNCVTVEDAI